MTVLLMGCHKQEQKAAPEPVRVDTIPMMVMQIQKCARFYAAECKMRKVIAFSETKKLAGTFMSHDFSVDLPMGNRKIAIPIDATVKAYIDFEGFSERNVQRQGDHIEIVLPDPEIALTATRIDHKEVKQHVSLLRSDFTDEELTRYERQGRDSLLLSIPQTGIIEMARHNAASILIPMIEQLGYSQDKITISFRKPFSTEEIRRFVEKTAVKDDKKGK